MGYSPWGHKESDKTYFTHLGPSTQMKDTGTVDQRNSPGIKLLWKERSLPP